MGYFNFAEKSYQEIEDAVASSSSPAPAAGSSAALTAILGISLIQLACRVQALRDRRDHSDRNVHDHNMEMEKDQDCQQQIIDLEEISSLLEDRQQSLYTLAEKDFCALENSCLAVCSASMTEVPLELAAEIINILEIINPLSRQITGDIKGDYNAGLQLLKAGYKSVLSIIKINYTRLSEEKRARCMKQHKILERRFARIDLE